MPVEVTATIGTAIADPMQRVALDGLLAAMVVLRDAIPPAGSYDEMVPVEIPVARSPGGRFHLCSHSIHEVEEIDEHVRTINRRPVVPEAQMLGRREGKGAIRRIQINAGPSKGYRFPLETAHLVDDRLTWYAMATDVPELKSLLDLCTHIGRRRAVGLGRVLRWEVRTMGSLDPWPGFPVLRDGVPLRPLPQDYPGLAEGHAVLRQRVTYPYWCGPREPVAVPDPPPVCEAA